MASFPRLLPLLAAACLAACEPAPPRETLDAHALRVQLRQLASVAAEAALLTRELEAGHLNPAFAWVHQQGLSDAARQAATGLAQPADPPLQATRHDALFLAADLQADVGRVADHRHDAADLQALRRQFEAVGERARALEPRP